MLKYLILGIIQGLTEFLPVSSSGHLVIAQRILGLGKDALAVAIILHLGTTLALIIFFFKDILRLLRNIRLIGLIILVTVITGIIGIGAKDFFERLFSSVFYVAIGLFITGIILILTKKITSNLRKEINIKDALILGLTQAIAIIPGISRSGTTISTLLFRKLDRETAFRFSFLAAIPAILGATLLEFKEINFSLKENFVNLGIGCIFSFFSGILSLWVLSRVVEKAKLYYFGYYCIVVGIIVILFVK